MALPLEAYALIGDTQSAALVGNDGSIDWLCWPRFDSEACFAALLGDERHGRWLLAPAGPVRRVHRRYLPPSLVLETDLETEGGTVRLVDFMPPRGEAPDIVRIVQCLEGHVPMRLELTPRFGYGDRTPWLRLDSGGASALAGPDAVVLRTDVPLRLEDARLLSDFTLGPGQRAAFVLTWFPSHRPAPSPVEPVAALEDTLSWWQAWCSHRTSGGCGPWSDPVQRSLVTLKALTYSPTGGIVAAPTTSLPEHLGGVRNWDYRFCWLRDATLALLCLLDAGFTEEALAWRNWLLRAVAGEPEELQIMYGVAGERRLTEFELPWLPGYEASGPVRIGNGAVQQHQLDVFGEVMDCLHQSRIAGLGVDRESWELQRHLLRYVERCWEAPDEGLWEVRGGRRHFTHSKIMAWVALDRAVKSAEHFHLEAPLEQWKRLRARMHAQICERGYDASRGAFVQTYGGRELDASLLMIPLVGFLPATDARVRGTVEAIERELSEDGFVHRYDTRERVDGLPPGEGVFLACSFWLADNYILMGRTREARALFERLLEVRNDVGLLSEEYDLRRRRMVGNFPQAFSHMALVTTALNLTRAEGPGRQRARE